MSGINRDTGQPLDGVEHVMQSIRDILTTRIGTRVMLYEYGSKLPDLVDAPLNDETILSIIAESAIAISRWEKRVIVKRVVVTPSDVVDGEAIVELYCVYKENGNDFKVTL